METLRQVAGTVAVVAAMAGGGHVGAAGAVADANPTNSFIRFVEDARGGRLETSVVRYQHPDGREVDLVGAVHLGDRAYYAGLNTMFKGYDAVLYELVGGKAEDIEAGKKKDEKVGADDPMVAMIGKLQMQITNLLGLEHQLAVVDYKAPNFVHADVTWEEFRKLQGDRGENLMSLLGKAMDAEARLAREKKEGEGAPKKEEGAGAGGLGGLLGELLGGGQGEVRELVEMVQALTNGDSGRLKMMMGRQMEDAEKLVGHLEAGEGTAILSGRNEVAIRKLNEVQAGGKKRSAIFYGAGHLPDMEKRLLSAGYVRGEVRWLTAWDIPNQAAPAPEGGNEDGGKAVDAKKAA